MFLQRLNVRLVLALIVMFLNGCICIDKNENSYNTLFDKIWVFDEQDNPICINPNEYLKYVSLCKYTPKIYTHLNENGAFEVIDSQTGTKIYTTEIGECITLVGYDDENHYFISNAESNFYRLEKYNKRINKFKTIIEGNADLFNVLFDKSNNTANIAIAEFNNGEKIYFNEEFLIAEKFIEKNFNPNQIIWSCKSKKTNKWIIRLLFQNRPELNIIFDFNYKKITKLENESTKWKISSIRKEIYFYSRDGVKINVILTYPKEKITISELPTIIFPHGGPSAHDNLNFDYRADILAKAGFLVVQPNYRGSNGFGKEFRFAGFGTDGIKKAQQDIEDCVKFLIKNKISNKDNIAILGGSWGGFCAAYALAFTPEIYKAGVLLFGCYDLVDMLKTQPEKSGANKGLDKLQYGDISKENLALYNISPISKVKNISASILMLHFFDDKVIEFAQSKKFYNELKKYNKRVQFISDNGEHGFENYQAEENQYRIIIQFLQETMKIKSK